MANAKSGPEVQCANVDCRVAETGRCVEGLTLDACPHYGRALESDGGSKDSVDPSASRSVALPPAGTLTSAEASAVLRLGPARVIAVIGPRDAGKTSLIASLYDLFQEGAIDGLEFSRSRTLHAFEHTCHDARALSRRGVPHMSRTPRGDVRFYHIEIGGGAAGARLALLLGDRAGEEYREAADDVTVVTRFSEIERADTVTVLVDGERLLGGTRHNVRSDVTMMLQGLRDGGALRSGVRLALVLTKLDAIRAAVDGDHALRDFQTLVSDVRRLFGNELGQIDAFEVAASPKTEALPRGTGVGRLLSFWLGAAATVTGIDTERPVHERAFARLRPREERPEATHD